MATIECTPFSGKYRHPNFKDLTGERFGRLTVAKLKGKSERGTSVWICLCDCGIKTDAGVGNLRSGNVQSCGCLETDAKTTHGMRGTPEYEVWKAMWQRCTNPRNKNHATYKDRTPPESWRDFAAFIADIGMRPAPGYSLERIDNTKPYGPGNTAWIPAGQQARNTKANRWLTYNGHTKLITDWARELGLVPSSLRERIQKWGLDKALSTPKRRNIHDTQ